MDESKQEGLVSLTADGGVQKRVLVEGTGELPEDGADVTGTLQGVMCALSCRCTPTITYTIYHRGLLVLTCICL